MPPPFSATATRVATHWAVDALAGDEGLDFSLLKGKRLHPQSASSALLHAFVHSLTKVG
jgi:hypothetical protein